MRGPRHGRREPQVRWAIGDTRGTRNLSSRAGPLRERVDGMDLVIDAHMAEEAEEARRVEVGLPCGIIAFASESPGSTSLTELIHPRDVRARRPALTYKNSPKSAEDAPRRQRSTPCHPPADAPVRRVRMRGRGRGRGLACVPDRRRRGCAGAGRDGPVLPRVLTGLRGPTRSPILALSAYAVKATDTGRIPWKMHMNRPSQRPTTRNW